MEIMTKKAGRQAVPAVEFQVTKASGDLAAFSEEKLRHSLSRTGAGAAVIDAIAAEVRHSLYDGITTREIYRQAFALLKKHARLYAGRYHIKKALLEFGPSGFPFEKYIAAILDRKGYHTRINQLLPGRCVTHEVDVLAHNGTTRAMIECKFHNRRGTTCDVKVPLYIRSRFDDIRQVWEQQPAEKAYANEGWVVTNTHFTDDAVRYGTCAGLRLIGWNHPAKDNLQHWIESTGMYPVTCLTTLTLGEKRKILEAGTVLCSDLAAARQVLVRAGIPPERISGVLAECRELARPVDADQSLH